MGDFHTLVVASGCNCVDPINDACKGRYACNNGTDLYSWGFNIHGQCDGFPSEDSILVPKIVPFFKTNNYQITKIAARRSRSIAITTENKVYEWGFVGEDGIQFKKLFNLPDECIQVEIGLEFNLFLLKNGAVYMSGIIT